MSVTHHACPVETDKGEVVFDYTFDGEDIEFRAAVCGDCLSDADIDAAWEANRDTLIAAAIGDRNDQADLRAEAAYERRIGL